MKVLLISPLNPKKPGKLKFLSGESTFTEILLNHSPKGVNYTYLEEAINKGEVEYSFWQKPLNYLIKLRILPLSPRIICIKVMGNFDLIHSHGHPLKLEGIHPPVILSDSSGNYQFLKGYLGWNDLRIKVGYFLKRKVYRLLNIYDQEVNLKEANLIVWSNFTKKIHLDLGVDSKKMVVIPPGIEKIARVNSKNKKKTFNILFIGTWFVRKGGLVLLEALKKLYNKYPKIHAYIIGEVPKQIGLPSYVTQKNYVLRRKLLKNIFPKVDVLVLVPPEAEGYGISPLEAASLGIPSIVSSINALPEIIDNNQTGFIIPPNNPNALVLALEKLIINPVLKNRMGREANKKFLKKFWIKKTNESLLKAYLSSALPH